MIKKYEILKGGTYELNQAVNKAIQSGWQPFGNVFNWSNNLCQVIVKYFDDEEKMVIKTPLEENLKDDLREE